MMAFLAPLFALPRWVKIAIGVALLIGLVLLIHKCAVDDAVEADRNASKAKAVSRAREADEGAHRAAEGTREAVEQRNDEARRAAKEADDPLKAGLDKLREGR